MDIHTASGMPGRGTAADSDPPIRPADTDYRAQASAAAEKFEGFFVHQMLRQMRASTREWAGEGSAVKDPVNDDMLDLADTLMADKLASQRAFGIADAILRQLLPPASAGPALNGAPGAVAFSKQGTAVCHDEAGAGLSIPENSTPSRP